MTLVSVKRAVFQVFYGLGRENVDLQFHSLRQDVVRVCSRTFAHEGGQRHEFGRAKAWRWPIAVLGAILW